MIKLLRQHLLKNKELVSLLSNNQAIYHIEKPLKIEDTTFIVVRDKLLSGYYIEEYQLTFNVESPDLEKVLAIEKELINHLNDPREEKIIKNNNTYIRNIKVLNGGGRIRTPEDNWMSVVYFLLKK